MSSDIRRRPEGALLRTYLRAAGIAPESIAKPLIGVVTVSTQVFSEHPLARDLGVSAAKGVELSGGFAVIKDILKKIGYTGTIIVYENIDDAIIYIQNNSKSDDINIVTGSLYLVGEVRNKLGLEFIL